MSATLSPNLIAQIIHSISPSQPVLIKTLPFYIEQKLNKPWHQLGEYHNGMTLTKYLETNADYFRVVKKGPGMHEVELIKGAEMKTAPATQDSGIKDSAVKTEPKGTTQNAQTTKQNVTQPKSVQSPPKIPSKTSRPTESSTAKPASSPAPAPKATTATPKAAPTPAPKTETTPTKTESSPKPDTSSVAQKQQKTQIQAESLIGVQSSDASMDSMDDITRYIQQEKQNDTKPLFDTSPVTPQDDNEVDDLLRELNEDEEYIKQQLAEASNEEEMPSQGTTAPKPTQQEEAITPNTDATRKLEEAQRILEEARRKEQEVLAEKERLQQEQEQPQLQASPNSLAALKKTWIYGWLADLHMEHYIQNFVDYGVTDEDTLAGIEKSDLNKMQVKNLDDRNTIFQQIEHKKKQSTLSKLSNMDFDF